MLGIFNKKETNIHVEIAQLLLSYICKSNGIKSLDQNKYNGTREEIDSYKIRTAEIIDKCLIYYQKNKETTISLLKNNIEIITYILRYEKERRTDLGCNIIITFSLLEIKKNNIKLSDEVFKTLYDHLAHRFSHYDIKYCNIKDKTNPTQSLLDTLKECLPRSIHGIGYNIKNESKNNEQNQIKDNKVIIDEKLKVFEKLISVLPLNDFKKDLLDINLKIETLFSSLLELKDFDKNIINTYIKYKEEILGNYLNNYSILKLDKNKNKLAETETIEQLNKIFNSLEQIKEEKINEAMENINTQKIFLSKKLK